MWRFVEASSFFILICICFGKSHGWRSFTINISNASVVTYSDKYRANLTVHNNALNLIFEMREDLLHPVIRAEIYMQSPDSGQYNIEVMNRTIDGCTFFTNKMYEPLIQIIYRIIQNYGDFPDSCPVKMNTFHFENLKPDAELFPAYLPERRLYFRVTYLKNERGRLIRIAQSKLFLEIKSKAGKRFNILKLQRQLIVNESK